MLHYDRSSTSVLVIEPASNVNNQGTTIKVESVPGAGNPTVTLKIPYLGIEQVVELYKTAPTPIGATGRSISSFQHSASALLDYTLLGSWIVRDTNGLAEYGSAFVTGFHTPVSGKPIGSATYTGLVSGFLFPNGATVTGSDKQLAGSGTVTADFGTNQVNGSFTNIFVNASTAWNNVTLSGGTISGTTITGGVTSLGSTPSEPDVFTNATGSFNGGLFGPNAEELGLIWTLRDTPTGSIAVGTFGGVKP